MKKPQRLGLIVGVVALLLVVAAFGIRGYMVWDRTRDVLPAFAPIPDGPRAPPLSLLGLTPGQSTLAEVQALTSSLGVTCRDTSMRGLMQAGRDEAHRKIAEAKARGEDPDTVSGASRAGYYSKKEQNPQIQWACDDVDLGRLPAAAMPSEPKADLVFVFDSADLPLRYITVSRKFMSQAAALAARTEALARYVALGPSTTSMGEPDLDPTHKIFERLRLVTRAWEYADRRVTVTVMNFGPTRGIDVRETLEIPWPIEVLERE